MQTSATLLTRLSTAFKESLAPQFKKSKRSPSLPLASFTKEVTTLNAQPSSNATITKSPEMFLQRSDSSMTMKEVTAMLPIPAVKIKAAMLPVTMTRIVVRMMKKRMAIIMVMTMIIIPLCMNMSIVPLRTSTLWTLKTSSLPTWWPSGTPILSTTMTTSHSIFMNFQHTSPKKKR